MITGGVNRPWMCDKRWTHSWESDRGALDNLSTVGTWSPQKGGLAWTGSGSTRPASSASLGTNLHRTIDFTAASSHNLRCDGLATLLSGTTKFSIMLLFKYTALADFKTLIGFGDTSNTKNYGVMQTDSTAPTRNFYVEWGDSQTAPAHSTQPAQVTPGADTNWHIWGMRLFPPTSTFVTFEHYFDGVANSSGRTSSGTWGTQTLTKATLAGFTGASLTQSASVSIRTIIVAVNTHLSNAEMDASRLSLLAQKT